MQFVIVYSCGFESILAECQSKKFHFFLFHFPQSLRYSYFQVGQILGPHPQSQEVKKAQARPVPQKQVSEPKLNPQQPSSESKASANARNQQQHPHQPLQQIPLPQTEKQGVSNAVSNPMQYLCP